MSITSAVSSLFTPQPNQNSGTNTQTNQTDQTDETSSTPPATGGSAGSGGTTTSGTSESGSGSTGGGTTSSGSSAPSSSSAAAQRSASTQSSASAAPARAEPLVSLAAEAPSPGAQLAEARLLAEQAQEATQSQLVVQEITDTAEKATAEDTDDGQAENTGEAQRARFEANLDVVRSFAVPEPASGIDFRS